MKKITPEMTHVIMKAVAYSFSCLIPCSWYTAYEGVYTYNREFKSDDEWFDKSPMRVISFCISLIDSGIIPSPSVGDMYKHIESIVSASYESLSFEVSDFGEECDEALKRIENNIHYLQQKHSPLPKCFHAVKDVDAWKAESISRMYKNAREIERYRNLYYTLKKIDSAAFDDIEKVAERQIRKENIITDNENSKRGAVEASRQLRALGFVA